MPMRLQGYSTGYLTLGRSGRSTHCSWRQHSSHVWNYRGPCFWSSLPLQLVTLAYHLQTGTLLKSTRDFKTDKAWNWLRVEGPISDYIVMEDRGSNTFESVVKDGWPAKIQSNRPDGSYATKDLFLRHSEHSNWYKYIGRLDDTLVMLLGEKTNPGMLHEYLPKQGS